jgi:stalled ribosome rescue protein Dom34
MESTNKLGIWMDHSEANLIHLKADNENQVIRSKFSFSTKEEALQKGEKHMHTKEQHLHEAYYKEIANEILKYDHVLLFGPTNAKAELHNYLNKDLHFERVKVDVESADKMTDNEKAAFVKAHFSKKAK